MSPTTRVPAVESSSNTLHAHLDVGISSTRSRSSSVGDSSVLSGVTVRPDTPYNGIDTLSVSEALEPDPGTEKDFVVPGINPFAFSPGQLNKFLNPKSLPAYKAVGGIRGLERGLRTNLVAGLSTDEGALDGAVLFHEATNATRDYHKKKLGSLDSTAASSSPPPKQSSGDAQDHPFVDRERVFSRNVLPARGTKSIWRFMWELYQDKILLLLSAAAVISLALGLYETFGVHHKPGDPPAVDWVEGVAIVIAIVIVVLVGSLNDWQKERQFMKLNAKVA